MSGERTGRPMIIDLAACAIVTAVLQFITPMWWWVMVVPFLWCTIRDLSGWSAFRLGASSGMVVWLVCAGYSWLTGSQIVVSRVAVAMMVQIPILALALTVLLAAIAGGLAAATGQAARVALARRS